MGLFELQEDGFLFATFVFIDRPTKLTVELAGENIRALLKKLFEIKF
jgi:hypothetical protein